MNNINNNAILFQPTGEVRRAKKGEWKLVTWPIGLSEIMMELSEKSANKHPIYTRHEIPAEVGKKMMEGEDAL